MTVTPGAMIAIDEIEVTEAVTEKGNSNLEDVLMITVVVDRGTKRTDVETIVVTAEVEVEEKMTSLRDLGAVVMMTEEVIVGVEETGVEAVVGM